MSEATIVFSVIIIVIGLIFLARYVHLSSKLKEESGTQEKNLNLMNNYEHKELVFKDAYKNELVFHVPEMNSLTKYHALEKGSLMKLGGHVLQGALPTIATAKTVSDLKSAGDLFVATTDSRNLMKYKDGTISSIIRKDNKFSGKAGFKEVGISEVNQTIISINVGMQLLAAISGQYFLSEINDKILTIENQLEKIIELHHNEKISILLNANKRVAEITARNTIDDMDIIELRSLANKVNEVFLEYQQYFMKEYTKVESFRGRKMSEKMIVNKRIDAFLEDMEQIKLPLQISFEADRLKNYINMAEISARMKRDYSDKMLTELGKELEDNLQHSFSINMQKNIRKEMNLVDIISDEVIKTGKDFGILGKDREKLESRVNTKRNEIFEIVQKEDTHIMQELIKINNEEKDILLVHNRKDNTYIPYISEESLPRGYNINN